jgi:hypothetical protein
MTEFGRRLHLAEEALQGLLTLQDRLLLPYTVAFTSYLVILGHVGMPRAMLNAVP